MSIRYPRARLLAAAVLFSTGGAAIKSLTLTSWQIAGFRSGIAAIAVWLMVPAARRSWTWRTLVVGAAYAVTLIMYVVANKLTTAANTIFLQSTAPLYILLLGPWLLKERFRQRDLGFMALIGLGLALFFVDQQAPVATAPDPFLGNLVALATGVSWALTVVGLRWLGSREGTTEGAAAGSVVLGNALAFVLMAPFAFPVGAYPVEDWLVVIYLGVFQIALAYVFVTSALREIPAFEASLILLVEPALNPLWAWMVHGETPGVWAITGGVLILSATVFKTWLDARPRLRMVPIE
ncbi:MAG: DMT family transporter [Gemmatimonadales bacterium]